MPTDSSSPEKQAVLAKLLDAGEEAEDDKQARQWCELLKSEEGGLLSAVFTERDLASSAGAGRGGC